MAERLREQLERDVVLVDGGMGTTLRDRGEFVDSRTWSGNPLLSSLGRQAVVKAHQDFIEAGAVINITNTFRSQHRYLREHNLGHRARQITRIACGLARQARRRSNVPGVITAGSAAPLGDCYTPSDTPQAYELAAGHADHARGLKEVGVDLYLAETMITIREIKIALQAGQDVGLPLALSLCTSKDGQSLRSGEPLQDVVKAVKRFDLEALLFNCIDPETATRAVKCAKDLTDLPLGVYAQLGEDPNGLLNDSINPNSYYLAEAAQWLDLGVRAIGGCCGVTPDYIQDMGELLAQ